MSTCRMCFAGRHVRCLDKTACGCAPCSLRRSRPAPPPVMVQRRSSVPAKENRRNGNGPGRGGFQPGHAFCGAGGRTQMLPVEVVEAAVRLRREGKSWVAIGDELGHNRTALRRAVTRFYDDESLLGWRIPKRAVTDEQIQRAIEMRSQTPPVPWKDIAAELGVGRSTINMAVRRQRELAAA